MFIELNYRMKWTFSISSALSITIKHFTLIISKEHPFAPPSLYCWYQMNGRGDKTHRWFFVCRRCITSIITKSPCAHNSPRPGLAGHQPHAGPTLASLIKTAKAQNTAPAKCTHQSSLYLPPLLHLTYLAVWVSAAPGARCQPIIVLRLATDWRGPASAQPRISGISSLRPWPLLTSAHLSSTTTTRVLLDINTSHPTISLTGTSTLMSLVRRSGSVKR